MRLHGGVGRGRPCEGGAVWSRDMAGGWTRDGVVQDQSGDMVRDAALAARARMPAGVRETQGRGGGGASAGGGIRIGR